MHITTARVLLFLVFIIELLFWIPARVSNSVWCSFFLGPVVSSAVCVCVCGTSKRARPYRIRERCPFACPYANGTAEGKGKREYKESIKRFTNSALTALLSLSDCTRKRPFIIEITRRGIPGQRFLFGLAALVVYRHCCCHTRSSFATHWRLPLGILLVHWQCGERVFVMSLKPTLVFKSYERSS